MASAADDARPDRPAVRRLQPYSRVELVLLRFDAVLVLGADAAAPLAAQAERILGELQEPGVHVLHVGDVRQESAARLAANVEKVLSELLQRS
eukprot:CAMPEP_0180482832 /NCGR_PEP_ID=MMETSP1036_2-20121128/35108_1 /TAXON_ID=632150 /ORGANISM="Azadinium spinosum, Strain 3D9" /LENGTH=92 /DNA_ID=CAMNT_0022490617 /DNA_START=698 /DNA_END=976 /DNA_ORIENTATION=+